MPRWVLPRLLSKPQKRDQVYEIAFEDVALCFIRRRVCWFIQTWRGRRRSVKKAMYILLVHTIRMLCVISRSLITSSNLPPKSAFLPNFHGANACPLSNISSSVLWEHEKNMQNATKLNVVPKMKYAVYAMLRTANASGVAQLVAMARETASPHVFGDVHETGPRNCRQTIRADDECFGCRVVIENNPDNCVVP